MDDLDRKILALLAKNARMPVKEIAEKVALTSPAVSSRIHKLETDGTQYFVMGKVRIKVSEHFAQDGKPLDSLLEDVIQHAAAAS